MLESDLRVKRVNISKFDQFSTYEWIHSGSYNRFERSLIRRVLKSSSSNSDFALDIGCGPGLVLREMCHVHGHCVGVDISPRILRRAKNQFRSGENMDIDLLCADVEFMPFRGSVFGVATMYSVLHHLPNIEGSLEEINRIMKSNSNLILFHEPNEMRIRRIFEKTLIRILGKVRAAFLRSIHKSRWNQFTQEAQHRSTQLGKLENLADIHSKKGFSVMGIRILMEKSGFEIIKIKTRVQSFMTTFSRLHWPFKSIAVLDFVLSEVPILNNYLPLLLCVAKKKET